MQCKHTLRHNINLENHLRQSSSVLQPSNTHSGLNIQVLWRSARTRGRLCVCVCVCVRLFISHLDPFYLMAAKR